MYPGLSFQNSVTEYVCVSNIQTSNAEDVPTLFTRKKERRNAESVIRPIQRAVHADIRTTQTHITVTLSNKETKYTTQNIHRQDIKFI